MSESLHNANIDLLPTSALVLHYADIKCFEQDNRTTLVKMPQYYAAIKDMVYAQCTIFSDESSDWSALEPEVIRCFKNRIKERKYHFMKAIVDAIENDYARQVVLVANGYNPMAVALAERYPQVQFYVTDRSEVACTFNKAIYRQLGLDNLIVVQSDCAKEDLISKLREVSGRDYGRTGLFRQDMKTCFAFEGIIYYIDQDAEERLVTGCLDMNSSKNIVLYDYQDRDMLGITIKEAVDKYKSEPCYHIMMLDTIAKVTGCAKLRLSTFGEVFHYVDCYFDNEIVSDKKVYMYTLSLTKEDHTHLNQIDPSYDLAYALDVMDYRGCRIIRLVSDL